MAVLVASGPLACISPATFTTGYAPAPFPDTGAALGALSVRQFEDERPERVEFDMAPMFLLYLPLWPSFSYCDERPDEAVRDRKDRGPGAKPVSTPRSKPRPGSPTRKPAPKPLPPEPPAFADYAYPVSFARAIADDLRATDSFETVTQVGRSQPPASRLELRGRLLRTAQCQTLTSYFLGAPGVLLWMFPIPAGRVTSQIEVELSLVDSQTGAALWQGTIEQSDWTWYGLYTRLRGYQRGDLDDAAVPILGDDAGVDRTSIFQWEFELLRRGMLDVRPALIEAARGALEP
jgi:hypothetical protein